MAHTERRQQDQRQKPLATLKRATEEERQEVDSREEATAEGGDLKIRRSLSVRRE